MGEILEGVGDLLFSLVVSYLGALEFLYVVRHLYHWTFHHPNGDSNDADSLKRLQDDIRSQLDASAAAEGAAGANAMQDGVLYKDGFRIDPQQAEVDRLKAELNAKQEKEARRRQIEAELARQKLIEEETRKQLERAEAELEKQRQQAEKEQREAEERKNRAALDEAREMEENERKVLAAEKEKEERQRRREELERAEMTRSIEAEQRRLEEARNLRLAQLEVERETEEQQREIEQQQRREAEERERAEAERLKLLIDDEFEDERADLEAEKFLAAERDRELRQSEEEAASLLAAEREEERKQKTVEENLERLLDAERQREEVEEERKRRIKEENARKFLEAEEEMVELQRRMEEAVQSRRVSLTQQVSVVEEPCLRKEVKPLSDADSERVTQTVKTQFGQSNKEPYSLSPKALHFPSLSGDAADEAPSTLPEEKPSSLSARLEAAIGVGPPEDALEREAPDGEDNSPEIHYTDEYLRSLDGIKQRPLKREDGSGRRRAFKKHRSSGSSNSSRESRNSREEEIKMFTSLEEEEMQNAKAGDEDFTAIKYSREVPVAALKVKGHHRRHKRSPAKDPRVSDESLRSSLEMLNEENTNPWGEVVPEHYKDTAFWKREKGISIDEEEAESLKSAQERETEAATNVPNASSFEDATESQHEDALKTLQNQRPKQADDTQENLGMRNQSTNDNITNLQTSPNTARSPSPLTSKHLRLRRSPRIEELDQSEDHDQESASIQMSTPNITVEPAAEEREAWRDQYGLLVEGLSDFYDFTASVNPSRSRSTSRNPSRSTTPNPNTTQNPAAPKNVSYEVEKGNFTHDNEYNLSESHDLDVYDDTGNLDKVVLNNSTPIESMALEISETSQKSQESKDHPRSNSDSMNLGNKTDDSNKHAVQKEVPLISIDTVNEGAAGDEMEVSRDNMISLVESLRADRSRSHSRAPSERCRSRSRSKSPLPTPDNIQRSIESRRSKRIQQNDEFFQKLELTPPSDQEITADRKEEAPSITVECVDDSKSCQVDANEDMEGFVESLRVARTNSRSRSKSPMRIPTESNLRRSVETRRSKLIQKNDELLAELTERSQTPEPKIEVQYQFVPSSNTTPNFECENLSTPEALSNLSDYYDFHELLNRKANFEAENDVQSSSQKDDLRPSSNRKNGDGEEPEVSEWNNEENTEKDDKIGCNFDKEKLRQLKCTPTTPDYDRSISSELKDIERIKNEILASGYMRSTYVGESMDLGSEYEELRRKTAEFRRSESCSRSPFAEEDELIEKARHNAAEAREIQEEILAEITTDFGEVRDYESRHGAKPKVIVADSVNITTAQYEAMRRNAAEFRRSQSRSRSPLGPEESEALAEIDAEAAKRELQDRILDEIEKTTINFQDFSRHLNVDFFENERRASDSVLMQKPEMTSPEFPDSVPYLDIDPEDYHHYRRYSLRQEEPIEQYPSDDYVYMSQIEVQTPSGTRTWTREDYYGEAFGHLAMELPGSLKTSVQTIDDFVVEQFRGDDESDASEDERRTVVEVDDEIEEDISDSNERGLADESHHEQSECEEAEREMDRYADRRAADWKSVENLNETSNSGNSSDVLSEGGAVGGGNDSDSSAIEEIYSDAIRNRKQSGILRDYDSIIKDMQDNYLEDSPKRGRRVEFDEGLPTEKDRYAIWAKTRNMERLTPLRGNSYDSTLSFIENEKRDSERRYLGDASMTSRNSARLRSRYGYVPLLQGAAVDEIEVDLNYKPRREYNWRKNFKLDDNENDLDQTQSDRKEYTKKITDEQVQEEEVDMRKFSLGGDSITLFSRSPENEVMKEEGEHISAETEQSMKPNDGEVGAMLDEAVALLETTDKPKKKKIKRKIRRGSKGALERSSKDEEDSESQNCSRRSSCVQVDTDSSKGKLNSRRSSKSSLKNNDFAEVNTVPGNAESVEVGADKHNNTTEIPTPTKKIKKRKPNDLFLVIREPEITEEQQSSGENFGDNVQRPLVPISAAISPASAARNVLSSLSPANTPSPLEPTNANGSPNNSSTAPATRTAPTSSITDQFDILKDGNFYPLF